MGKPTIKAMSRRTARRLSRSPTAAGACVTRRWLVRHWYSCKRKPMDGPARTVNNREGAKCLPDTPTN